MITLATEDIKELTKLYKAEPNPIKTTFRRDATLHDIVKKAIEMFYKEFNPVCNDVTLAD